MSDDHDKWRAYPMCKCGKPYAVYLADARGPFKGIARGGRRLCHVCHGRVSLATTIHGGNCG